MNSLEHAYYYPCNRYQTFIFHLSVHLFRSVHVREKLGLGMRLTMYINKKQYYYG